MAGQLKRLAVVLIVLVITASFVLGSGCGESPSEPTPEPPPGVTPEPPSEPAPEPPLEPAPEPPPVVTPEPPPEVNQEPTSSSGSIFNQAPKITSATIDKEVVATSGTCQLTCEARDQDRRDVLTYTWSANGGTIRGADSTAIWTAPGTVGTYTIMVIVSDGKGGEATKKFTVSVFSEKNYPPFVNKLTADPREPYDDETCTLTCEATDIEGDEITYSWEVTGGTLEGEGQVVVWNPPDVPGDKEEHVVTVRVTDSAGNVSGRKWLHITLWCACVRPTERAEPAEEAPPTVPYSEEGTE